MASLSSLLSQVNDCADSKIVKHPLLIAHWISDPQRGALPNYTFLARQKFHLASIGESHALRIAADSRYVLHVNGERLGVGPARPSQLRYFYDEYEIANFLRPGENHIAVEVHSPAMPVYATASITPALFVQIDEFLGTDSDWQVLRDPSRRLDAPLYTFQLGFCESRDFRRAIFGWETFSDSSDDWLAAEVLAGPHELGSRQLVPRNIPLLEHTEYLPKCLITSGVVPRLTSEEAELLDFADLLQTELHFQAAWPKVQFLSSGIKVHPSPTGRGGFCVLDFEKEIIGTLRLKIEAPRGTIIDLAYGEALDNERIITRKFEYRFADRYIAAGGMQEFEGLHERGFRYLQIVFRCFDQPVIVHKISAQDHRYPMPVQATFKSDDAYLNNLWSISVETVSACSVDTFVDCPWREQVLWLNDMMVSGIFYAGLTADRFLPARSLRVAADGQDERGLIPVAPPSKTEIFTTAPAIMAVVLHHHHLYSDDLELVRELMPRIVRGLDLYRRWQDESGSVLIPERDDVTNFVDWAYSSDTAEIAGTTAVFNLVVAAGFKCASVLHAALGQTEESLRTLAEADAVATAVCRQFWDPSARHLIDCTEPPLKLPSSSQHSHALALYFDLLPPEYRADCLEALFDPSLIEAEFYYQHFVLAALARNGLESDALASIRRLWREMIESGSLTVWEAKAGTCAFEGCGSLCHAFSCTPLYFMQTVLLGIQPLRPGFTEFEINPRSLDLEWCRGTIPTPHGLIEVAWQAMPDELAISIVVPPGTVGVLRDGRRLLPGSHSILLAQETTARAVLPVAGSR